MFNMQIKSFILIVVISTVFLLSGCLQKSESEKHFSNAVAFMEMQMIKEGIIELKSGLRSSASSRDNFYNTSDFKLLEGSILMFEDKDKEAISVLEKARKEYKDNWNIYSILSSVYLKEKEYGKAANILKLVPADYLKYGQLEFMQGLDFFYNQKYKDAKDSLLIARDKFEQNSLTFNEKSGAQQFIKTGAGLMVNYLLARTTENLGEYEQSLDFYKNVQALTPTFPYIRENISIVENKILLQSNQANNKTLNTLSYLYYKIGEKDKSLQYIRKSLDFNSDDLEALKILAFIYEDRKETSKAKQLFIKIISTIGDIGYKTESASELAKIYMREGLYTEASKVLNGALKLDPVDKRLQNEFKALVFYGLISKNSKNIENYLQLGELLVSFGEVDSAILLYSKAPQNKDIYLKLGEIYFFKGEYKKATEALTKALKLAPKSWQALYILGKSLELSEQYENAQNSFLESLKNCPAEKINGIKYDLAYLYFENGDYKNAVELFKEIIKNKDQALKGKAEKILKVIG